MKILLYLLLIITSLSCTKHTGYYSLNDFEKVDKIDVHIHVTSNRNTFVEQAKIDRFRLLNIIVDFGKGPEYIKETYDKRQEIKTEHPNYYEVATSFSMKGWDEPEWLDNTMKFLEKNIEEGAIAVKFWKNIGMVFRDKNGDLVMIDDPKLDTIFKMLTKKNIAVVGHLGEPKNCWLPLDKMNANNDKVYYKEHPQYHMYLHPELPTYEQQIAARDRMLDNNSNLIFMGAHMGSLEWSVDELAKRLDKYPNMTVDLAARIGQVFYQTIEDRNKVRNFFIKYQDRLLYGTDLQDNGTMEASALKIRMHEYWIRDWQFLVTDNLLTSPLVDGKFKGIKLPKEVIDKIYSKNALKWLKMFPGDEM